MKKTLSLKETFLVASLLFGMLFGAGNLIFPVHMGQVAGYNSIKASIDFIITAVGIPLLSVVALAITKKSDAYELSSFVGHPFDTIFTVALYLTIGPLFAIPRCASTAFTVGMYSILPPKMHTIGLLIYSFIFFALILLLALKPNKIVDYIGKFINPAFLVFFVFLLVYALLDPTMSMQEVLPEAQFDKAPLFNGFLEGYNTMDAIASLAFGIIIVNAIKDFGVKDSSKIAFSTITSGLIMAVVMAAIYFMTTIVGAQSRGMVPIADNGGIALSELAMYYFDNVGSYLMLIIVSLACFKTALGLIICLSEMFAKMFPKTLSEKGYTIVFTIVSFIIANFGLSTIIEFSLPVLMLLYPFTITLVFLSIIGGLFKYRKIVFKTVMIFIAIPAIIDFVKTLPTFIIDNLHLSPIISLGSLLPFNDLGLGFVIPALVGLVGSMLWVHFFVDDEKSITY